MVQQEQIVSEARRWIGTPYRHQGRNHLGLDCVGLVLLVGKAVGSMPKELDYQGYPRSGHDPRLMEELEKWFKPGGRGPGAILLLAYRDPARHLAIETPAGIVHVEYERRVTEHGLGPAWERRVRGCFAFRGGF